MERIYSFTLAQAWAFVLAAAGAVAALYAAGNAISKVIQAAKKPDMEQNRRISALETQVSDIKGFLANDKKRLDGVDEGQRVTMQALLAILDHNLDGNNYDQMRNAKDALQKHLIGM